jgi:uncharacterized iron-regulated membrane protein
LIAGLFLLIVGASGIVLNYKQPIFSALGLETKLPKPEESAGDPAGSAKIEFSTRTGDAAMPVRLERALEIARAEWGNVSLERIELKAECGDVLYKLKRKGGDELWVNAATGAHFSKGAYERLGKPGADGLPVRQRDWGKILIDLHTGKIGGEVGKAIMSFAALLLLLLTLSGVYLWLKPLLIRRQSARARAMVAVPPLPVAAPNHLRGPAKELVEA